MGARSLTYDPEGIMRLEGEAQAASQQRYLRADRISYWQPDERWELVGNVRVEEPQLRLHAGRARIEGERVWVEGLRYQLPQRPAAGQAELMEREGVRISFYDSSYSSCAPGRESWRLKVRELELDLDSGLGKARGVRLEMLGVPVFYLPYLVFPADGKRRTGLLWPRLGRSPEGKLDFSLPLYLNLAPHHDLLLVPRHVRGRGSMLQAEYRRLGRGGKGTVGAAFLPRDRELKHKRWLLTLNAAGQPQTGWQANLDYAAVSDPDYLEELGEGGLQVLRRTHLERLAQARYQVGGVDFTARLRGFQSIQRGLSGENEPYYQVPLLRLRLRPAERPFQWNPFLEMEYAYFHHEQRIRGHRLFLGPGLEFPMLWNWGYFRPRLQLRQGSYHLRLSGQGGDFQTPDYTVPVVSLDAGLVLERPAGPAGGWLQTLEPRLYYLQARATEQGDLPDFDTSLRSLSFDQFFRANRFNGLDRFGDSRQLALAVTSRLLDQQDGHEWLRLDVGQLFYFRDREVFLSAPRDRDRLSTSDLVLRLAGRSRRGLESTGELFWDARQGRAQQGDLGLQLKTSGDSTFYMGYQFNRRAGNREQLELSASLPLTSRWRLGLRHHRDLDRGRSMEELVGLEYNGCCWRWSFLYQYGLDEDNQHRRVVVLEFQLRGLGGTGQRVRRILREEIRGYP